jgi:hypothetical protein
MGKWGEKQGLKIGDAYLGEGYYRIKWYSCLFNEQCVIGGLSNPLIKHFVSSQSAPRTSE